MFGSSYLLILLLCVAFFSSYARNIGIVNKENKTAKSFHFSSSKGFMQKDEKSSLARVSVSSNVRPSIPKMPQAANDHNDLVLEKKPETKVEADAVAVATVVYWKLPHPKREEQQPGFNLDYAPPLTHPPVNN